MTGPMVDGPVPVHFFEIYTGEKFECSVADPVEFLQRRLTEA